jgi:hypothetical protein
MAIFDEKFSDSFYFLTCDEEKLFPVMQENEKTKQLHFRIGSSGSARTLDHPDPKKCALEASELEMFDAVINKGFFTRIRLVGGKKSLSITIAINTVGM